MQCTGYTKTLDLRDGDLVKLADARGTTLRVERGTLWVTQEHERRDVMLTAGDVWTVERNGLTLAQAHTGVALCLVGPGAGLAQLCGKRVGGGTRWIGNRERLIVLFTRWVHA